MKKSFPKHLKKGNTIGIIAPAGPIKDPTDIENAVKFFEKNGYKVELAAHLMDKKGYLAGNDEARAEDLNKFFADSKIDAILCARGGYGCVRILDKINFEIIKNNPKIFVGFSDVTALLSNITKNTGLVTFHGPMATSDFGEERVSEFTADCFFDYLSSDFSAPYKFKNNLKYKCLKGGSTDGELLGGNLAVLCSLIGTKFEPEFENKILFIEDVNEPLYKIDRMLQQLKFAGIFDTIKGLLVCGFTGLNETDNIEALVKDLLKDYKIPIGYGFSAIHSRSKTTLPIGANVRFDADNGVLEMFNSKI